MVLLVIDLQNGFECYPSIVYNTKKQIDKAQNTNSPIIFLEYFKHGPTIKDLRDRVEGYSKLLVVKKHGDDGAIEFLDTCYQNDFLSYVDEVRICGLYGEFCVKDTALGIKKFSPSSQIHLVKNAICGDLSWVKKKSGMKII